MSDLVNRQLADVFSENYLHGLKDLKLVDSGSDPHKSTGPAGSQYIVQDNALAGFLRIISPRTYVCPCRLHLCNSKTFFNRVGNTNKEY